MPRYSATINVMIKAVESAAKHLIRDFGEVEHLQVSRKGPGDFVSAADKRSEQILHDELLKARPDFGFLMEESGEVKGRDPSKRWIIDPLDGTNNFLHAIPHWCITVALEDNGEITHGITYDPIRDDLFWAEKGMGAFKRHQRLRVAGKKTLSKDLLVSSSSHDPKTFEKIAKVAVPRFLGATALDMAYVAAGSFDAVYSDNYSAWDVAAGSLLIKEAGGFVSTLNNTKDFLDSRNIVAANPDIHALMLKALS